MTPVAHTSVRVLDKVILLWIMPPLGFVLTLLQSPELRYLIANHTLAAVLTGAIAIRWQFQAPTPQLAIRLLLTTLLASLFLMIEWVHFLAGRPTIDNLTDVRMLVYSPFYGSVILFVLYGLYLAMLSDSEQRRHLNFFVRLMCWFHVIFLGYWLLLFAGWVPSVPRADLLRSNSTAYGALFVIAIMLLYHERIRISTTEVAVFTAVNVAVIFANRTRGAVLGLAAVLLYLHLRRLGWLRGVVLFRTVAASVFGLALLLVGGGRPNCSGRTPEPSVRFSRR